MAQLPRFEYIAYHNTDSGYVIDEFSLFANTVSRSDELITYERYMNFGKIKSKKFVTIPISEFEKYYTPLTDEIYEECKRRFAEKEAEKIGN